MRLRPAVLAVVALGAVPAVRAAHRRQLVLGATVDEQYRPLPGDGLIPRADVVATRSISIDAARDAVWPWLVQLGQGRGGFYSYDVLENLVGLGIHSADRVVPEWQDLAVGDEVHLAEQVALTAAVVEPGRVLVLAGVAPSDDGAPPYDMTWAFVLDPDPAPGRGCRLVVRERYGYRVPWAGRMVAPLTWLSGLMTHRMLRGIRDRAERA